MKAEAKRKQESDPVKTNAKRDLFAELCEGMEALAGARIKKRILQTHAMEFIREAGGGSVSSTRDESCLE